ncbi:MAG: hypothetical protein LC104_17990 [Bacteroidales bacterium]|nr:hypothetical protein [Bacteroidales bacterium]
MLSVPVIIALAVHLAIPATVSDQAIQKAVAVALVPLRAAAIGHIEQKSCYGCHNQGPPVIALQAGREKNFLTFPPEQRAEQADHIIRFIAENREKFRSGRGTGGQVDTAGALLLSLEQSGHPADENTAAVVSYLLQTQSQRDHWRSGSPRPPSEASHFTATWLALRALRVWGTPEQQPRIAHRTQSAHGWLLRTPAIDTEDHAFRLLALKEARAAASEIEKAAQDLLKLQRPNGGWGQLPTLPPDAYATGTALVALNWSGGLTVEAKSYRYGVGFLVRQQRSDGTWFVRSRSKPFQPYYESGFPYGKDQFISAAASGWAATALILASPPDHPRVLDSRRQDR